MPGPSENSTADTMPLLSVRWKAPRSGDSATESSKLTLLTEKASTPQR